MPSLKVGRLFKFRNVPYLLGHPVYSHNLKPIFFVKKILDNKNDTGTPIVAWFAKICNYDRKFIKFCLYKYMIPYMTERIQRNMRPANIHNNFCMNPDKSEYLLYTEWVQVVTIVRN